MPEESTYLLSLANSFSKCIDLARMSSSTERLKIYEKALILTNSFNDLITLYRVLPKESTLYHDVFEKIKQHHFICCW